jgi:hypothetical protein
MDPNESQSRPKFSLRIPKNSLSAKSVLQVQIAPAISYRRVHLQA